MCVSKSIGLAYIAERNFTIFALVYLYFRAISKHNPPGGGEGFYSEGRFFGGFFSVTSLGALIWRGLYMLGLILGILRYNCINPLNIFHKIGQAINPNVCIFEK